MMISLIYVNGSNTICGLTSPPADISCSRRFFLSERVSRGDIYLSHVLVLFYVSRILMLQEKVMSKRIYKIQDMTKRKKKKYFYCVVSFHYSLS